MAAQHKRGASGAAVCRTARVDGGGGGLHASARMWLRWHLLRHARIPRGGSRSATQEAAAPSPTSPAPPAAGAARPRQQHGAGGPAAQCCRARTQGGRCGGRALHAAKVGGRVDPSHRTRGAGSKGLLRVCARVCVCIALATTWGCVCVLVAVPSATPPTGCAWLGHGGWPAAAGRLCSCSRHRHPPLPRPPPPHVAATHLPPRVLLRAHVARGVAGVHAAKGARRGGRGPAGA